MTRRWVGWGKRQQPWALVLVVVAFSVTVTLGGCSDEAPVPVEGGSLADSGEPAPVAAPQVIDGDTVTLYFPGQGAVLYAEERVVAKVDSPRERIAQIVSEILAGPQNSVLKAPLPHDTQLRSIHFDPEEKIAWVDLGGGIDESGSRRELLAVYSLVNSVTENVNDVERLSLLWNGSQAETFAGHVDVSHPLLPSKYWVAR